MPVTGSVTASRSRSARAAAAANATPAASPSRPTVVTRPPASAFRSPLAAATGHSPLPPDKRHHFDVTICLANSSDSDHGGCWGPRALCLVHVR
jgi:hypothetical protein